MFAFFQENSYIANSFETLTNRLKGRVASDEEYSTNEACCGGSPFQLKQK